MKKTLLLITLILASLHNISAQNLLTNGGFETGGNGVGFNTSGIGYTQIFSPFVGTTVAGNFALTTNPAPLNATYLAGGDHTTGTGTMLIVDGSASAVGQPLFWEAGNTAGGNICGLTIGNNYVFSYWVKSVSNTVTNAATQSNLLLVTTGASAVALSSGSTTAPLPAAGWQKVTYSFTATAACVHLGLWNNNTSFVGNDFAVDDFSLTALPTATMVASATSACVGDTPAPFITFTGANGIAPYTFTYTLNSVSNTVTTVSGNTVNVPIPTTTAGIMTYTLVSVSYGTAPAPVFSQTQSAVAVVTIKNVPNGTISGSTTVCQDNASTFVTFVGSNGTPPYFFTYHIGAGPDQVVSSGTGNNAAVLVQTGTAGTFNYTLTNVSYSSGPQCAKILNSTATFIVNPTPTATITGTTNVCLNTPNTNVTFTGANGIAPYTFTYNINGGATQTVTTAAGNSVSVLVPTAAAGTFNYNLLSVTYGAAPSCPATVSGSAVVTVGPPTSTISVNTTVLAGGSATLTFYGTPLAIVNFTSPLGAASVLLDATGLATYNIPYIAVTTTFSLVDAISGIAPFCSNPLSGSVTITVNTTTCSLPLVEVDIDVPAPVCNIGDCTDLLAHFSNIGATTDYIVSSIPYCPSFPFTGGTVINATGDDTWSPLVNLPFQFNFYGNCYNKVLVGTNGVITFDIVGQTALGYCNWPFTQTIPNGGFPIKNAIYGVYQDTNIATPPVTNAAIQNVNYYVLNTGPNTAPNRVFVANFNELPQFSCGASVGFQTSQIVIHETTNIVDIFVNKRTSCTGWNSGSGLIGIQNQAGTLATVPPGRNTGTWSAMNEAWRFYPKNIPAVPTSIRWEQGAGNPIGAVNDNPLHVCPTGTTTYTAIVTYNNCGTVEVRKDITVNVAPPLPVASPQDIIICSASAAPPYTVNIDQTAFMLTGIPNPGDYLISYYENPTDAANADITNITNLSSYTFNGPIPKKIYVRIEDLVSTGCSNIRPFNIIIKNTPSGTISYPGPYCNNLATSQPVTEIALSPGGTYSYVSVPAGSFLQLDSATGAIIPSSSQVGTYIVTYFIPATPTCPAYSTSASLNIVLCTCTVTPSSTATTLCINTALATPITYTSSSPASSASVTTGTLPPGMTGVFAGGIFTVSGTPTTAGVYPYTVSMISGVDTCTATTTITVNPVATISLTSLPATANQTVCINTAIAPIQYTVGNGVTGATVTGLPAGVTGNYAAGVFTISGTPTVSGVFNYNVTTTGGCGSASLGGTITVNPLVTITLTSATTTTAQTVCINTSITAITYSVGNGGTGASVLGLPAGVTGTYAAGIFTISGSPTASGVFNYTVTTTGGCGSASLSGTITVNPNVTIALNTLPATANQTVCINTPIALITYGLANGATGATVIGLPTGVTGTYTPGVFNITGTPSVSGTFNYTVTTTGGCSTASLSGTITVNPLAVITLTSAAATTNQTVCINTPIANIIYGISNGGTGASVLGLPAGVTGTYAAGVFTVSGTPTASGTFNYTVTTTGGCGTASLSGIITVNPNATIALTSAANTANQTACRNALITPITYSVNTGGTGATVIGLPTGITGSFAAGVFTISGSSNTVGTSNYTVTTTGGCSSASLSGTITISPDVTIALTSALTTANQTLCINTPITAITYAIGNNGTGATTVGLPAGVTGNFVAGVYTLSGSPTVAGTFNYTITTSGGCGSATAMGTITVNPNATIALASAVGSNAQTVCISTPIANITYTVADGGTGATVLGLPTGVTGNFAAGTFTISGTPTVSGAFNYTVTTIGGCGMASLSGTITVSPNVTIALTSAPATASQTVCINTPITAITYAIGNNGTGATTVGLPAGVTGNFVAGVYTLSGLPSVAGTFNYTITTSGGCSTATATGTITVNPTATITLTSAPATTSQTLCVNTLLNNITYTVASGGTGATVTGLPAGVTGSFASGIFTISGTPTASGTFNYTVTTTGGCGAPSLSGTITVNPNATIALTSAPTTSGQTACLNALITPITYSINTGGTGATVIGLPIGITGNFVTGVFTISGSSNTTGTFNYTVTTTGGCSSASLSGTITISPDVTIALTSLPATANQTVCINTPIAAIKYAIANNGTGAVAVGLPTGITGNFAAGVYTLSGLPSVAGTFNYTVTTTGGCGSASASGTITVNPNATIALSSAAATASQTVCINVGITPITYSVANGGTGATIIGLPAGVIGTFAAGVFTISGTPTASGTFNYTVTTTGGCSSASLSGTITVTPNVILALTSALTTTNQTACINAAIATITYSVANGGVAGATVTGLPNGVTGSYNSTTKVFTIIGASTVAGTFNYTVNTSGGCSTDSETGTITINPNATIVLTSAVATTSQTICISNPTPITPIRYTVGNGATGASISSGGLPSGVTGSFAGGIFTISGTPSTAGIFNYAVTTSGGCSTASLTGVINVNPNATLLLTSAPNTTNQVVCVNTAISSITYALGNGATGVTATGFPAGVSGSVSGGVYTISGVATNVGVHNYSLTTTGGCGSATLNGIITVNPNATVALTSGAGTNAQSVCVDQEAIINITYTIGNGATSASVDSGELPSGVQQNFAAGILTISGTPTQSGNFAYTVRTSGGCAVATAAGTIHVDPLPVIVLPQDGYICVDQTGNPLVGSDFLINTNLSPGQYSFMWSDANGPILAATGSSYLAIAPGVYSVEVTNLNTGCHNIASTTVITSFPPEAVVANASAYFSEQQVVTVAVSPAGNYEYQLDGGAFQDSNQFISLQSGYHTITVRDKIGCGELSTTIRIIDYPKFFTPNDDSFHDTWNITDLKDQDASKIEIYDRYGKLLKEISPKGQGWDGTLNGRPLPSDDYWFKVYFVDENGISKIFRSHFALKR